MRTYNCRKATAAVATVTYCRKTREAVATVTNLWETRTCCLLSQLSQLFYDEVFFRERILW
jgi:hypothetical protein